jgi:hypothetical protein
VKDKICYRFEGREIASTYEHRRAALALCVWCSHWDGWEEEGDDMVSRLLPASTGHITMMRLCSASGKWYSMSVQAR